MVRNGGELLATGASERLHDAFLIMSLNIFW